ncbi:hypothetical protein GCM10027403_12650 [Arthrobacter tecti]
MSWVTQDGESDPLRAWIRRPAALRVETADGAVLHSSTGNEQSRDALYVSASKKSWLVAPRLVSPVYNDVGYVHRRPQAAYGDPAFGDPRWTAMLDPVELAGAAPVPFETPFANRVELEDVAEETYEGRAALAATVTPNVSYQPFTPGRPLIGTGNTRVVVDIATAICVSTTALDGELAGCGHRLAISGVDEYMVDDLFIDAPPTLTDVREHMPWQVS